MNSKLPVLQFIPILITITMKTEIYLWWLIFMFIFGGEYIVYISRSNCAARSLSLSLSSQTIKLFMAKNRLLHKWNGGEEKI